MAKSPGTRYSTYRDAWLVSTPWQIRPTVAFATNLLGAMAGGVAEYLSLVAGFRMLLLIIALCYIGAVLARRSESGRPAAAAVGTV